MRPPGRCSPVTRVAALFAALLVSTAAQAAELKYKWSKGDVHRFTHEEELTADGDALSVRATYALRVLDAELDGKAQVQLTVESLQQVQGRRKTSLLARVPEAVRTVKADVDANGRMNLKKGVWLYPHHDAAVMGEQRSDKQAIAIPPRDLWDLIVLPDGPLDPASQAETPTRFGNVFTTMDGLDGDVATLRMSVVPQPGRPPPPPEEPPPAAGPKEFMPGKAIIPGMPEEKTPARPPKPVVPVVTEEAESDIVVKFDVGAGMLISAEGTVTRSRGRTKIRLVRVQE